MLPVLLALAFIAILLIVLIAGKPDDFVVKRATTISASPDLVFPHVNDLHKWEAWSPWAKLDPNMKSTFEGSGEGTGSAMSWSGNKKVGEGKMTITETTPSSLIRIRLEFLKPFKSTSTAEFTFAATGSGTLVTWGMFGKSNLASKVFSLFLNCENMVGRDFDKGLASLKSVAEAAA